MNVKGGPDRRYKDNRQFPILAYGSLSLEGRNGFTIVWQLSSVTPAASFAGTISAMASSPINSE